MKLKYKLILLFSIIIIASLLPISFFILRHQEEERIELLLRRSIIDCRMLAHSAMNVLLMSGGDISAAKLDLGEMITMVSPLAGDGLVHADIILLSAKMEYNGLVLAALDFDRRRRGAGKAAERISPDEIREMLDSGNVREFTGHDGDVLRLHGNLGSARPRTDVRWPARIFTGAHPRSGG